MNFDEELSCDQLEYIKVFTSELASEKKEDVRQIIQQDPNHQSSPEGEDETEINLQKLSRPTLWTLYHFCLANDIQGYHRRWNLRGRTRIPGGP